MVKGNVKWLNQKRGYGFLCRENGDDVFVHYTAIQKEGFKTLREGESVEFEVRDRSKDHPEAVNVRVSLEKS